MKPPPFKYLAPDSLEQALELMAQYGQEAKLLAGGQSLIPAMNFRVAQPAVLVDLNRATTLNYIQLQGDGSVAVGAMTRQRDLEFDPQIAERVPLLHECMPHVAHPQIRNRGTLGGSLAHADPAAELPVVAVAASARIRVQSSEGERWVEADQFFKGMFTTALQPGEILVEVVFPPAQARTGWSFLEASRRRGDYAMMGVAAGLSLSAQGVCSEARLVYMNAGDGPIVARQAAAGLSGQRPGPEAFEQAAAAAQQEIDPLGNVHASVDYQRHLATVLTRRALAIAAERARGNGSSPAADAG
jgi:carbon-monoxide dehydrogenase medium subunit